MNVAWTKWCRCGRGISPERDECQRCDAVRAIVREESLQAYARAGCPLRAEVAALRERVEALEGEK